MKHTMNSLNNIQEDLQKILKELDNIKYGNKGETFGDLAADKAVSFIGSWRFIILQSSLLIFWIIINSVWIILGSAFDPYPFILLNLTLSFQSAFASPLILMASNRSASKDRIRAADAYRSIEQIEQMMILLVNELKSNVDEDEEN
jgi:uncharacterized membrane protein